MSSHDDNASGHAPRARLGIWGGRLLEGLVFAAVCFGIWMLTLSSYDSEDALVAGGVVLVCGALGAAARWAIDGHWAIDPRLLRPLARVPLVTLVDTAQVLSSPLRRRSAGRFSTFRLAGGAGDSSSATARRAHATLVLSFSPGSYVCDIDPADGTVLVHHFGGPGPSLEDQLTE